MEEKKEMQYKKEKELLTVLRNKYEKKFSFFFISLLVRNLKYNHDLCVLFRVKAKLKFFCFCVHGFNRFVLRKKLLTKKLQTLKILLCQKHKTGTNQYSMCQILINNLK
jgi:hypothetical protein